MRKSEKIILSTAGTLLVVLLVVSFSYALWSVTRIQENPNVVTSGCFSLELVPGTALDLSGEFPLTDAEGMEKDPYTFSIKNTCSIGASVNIKLLVMNETTIDLGHLKVALDGDAGVASALLSSFENGTTTTMEISHTKILTSVYIPGNTTKSYELRVWLDESVTKDQERNAVLKAKVEIDGSAAPEPPLACSFESDVINPELGNGLIPVIYADEKWVKADTTQQWYDYCTQWWANAVTVTEETRSTYASAAAGTEIPMDDINTMWVWIPRYEYQTDNLGENYAGGTKYLPLGININFIPKSTTTPSASNYIVHPAFWWDTNSDGIETSDEQLSGFWFAKFDMSVKYMGSDVLEMPIVKPDKSSVGRCVAELWHMIYQYMNSENGMKYYGIYDSDTHMIKNIDWGAVAYLSQSAYGKYGNPDYEGQAKEIYLNNSAHGYTGRSAGSSYTYSTNNYPGYYSYDGRKCSTDDCVTTNKVSNINSSTGASTTGNIYGIYDMSGSSWDAVMATIKCKGTNQPSIGGSSYDNSKFSGCTSSGYSYTGEYPSLADYGSKYYDLYDYNEDMDDFSGYKYGDGTFETHSWYNGLAFFAYRDRPWFIRGNSYNDPSDSSIFSSSASSGVSMINVSTRPILVADKD